MPSAIRVIDDITELVATGFAAKNLPVWSGSVFAPSTGFEWQSGASPNLYIQAQNAAHTPLVVKGAASQSVNLQAWQNSAGSVMGRVQERGTYHCDLGLGDVTSLFVGYNAGVAFGSGNTCIGYRSGALLEAGATDNTFVGASAGWHVTTGDRNMAFGTNALRDLTAGSDNVALGAQAGANLDTSAASKNVAIGSQAMTYDETGGDNVVIGYQAGFGVSGQSFEDNVIIGSSAMKSVTTSERNVCIGSSAGYSITTSGYNVAIGFNASISGNVNYQTSLGAFAGYSGASRSVCLGYAAGFFSTGLRCIFIGRSAGYRQTTTNDLLVIDNQERVNAATELSNAIIYGVMAATPAGQSLRINAYLTLSTVKSGATQAAAGAAAGEVWKTASHATLPDNVLMIGV